MSRWADRCDKIQAYWDGVFDPGIVHEVCMICSVGLLGVLYFFGMIYMVPHSVFQSFWSKA